MARAKLIVLVALVLVICQAQCVAACAVAACVPGDSTSSQNPPCHRHHNHSSNPHPTPCSHESTASMAVSQAAPQAWAMTTVAPLVSAAPDAPSPTYSVIPARAVTQPERFALSSIVLRI
ncbi:MAG TPA: hypothetical protein VG096_05890 [Bryobacteraceae bacterium]|nr:hypothetical protein [Bryobacteraceae bacterium]